MPSLDWKPTIERLRARLRSMPRWAWVALASVALALIFLLAFIPSGPTYAPLFDGLSAHDGGEVISKLQKLGIPYQLGANGTVIRVPQAQIGQARLQLGQMGVPADAGSAAWQKLTSGSLTTSETAERALSKRALEDSITKSIEHIRGIHSARVTLAIPRSTPFLEDQPHPKASVWLDTSGISSTQARAIAQMVANAVPGLDAGRVTVTDQNGDLLAPVQDGGIGEAQHQLAFTTQIENQAARRITALLSPVVGRKNLRVSVAASIDYSKTTQKQIAYLPGSQVRHLQHDQKTQHGSQNPDQGIPGALSNQPPGNASAPLKTTAKKGANKPTLKQLLALQPQSKHDKWDLRYDVNQKTSVTVQPGWSVKALSVSVVLNRKMSKGIAAQVHSIVSHAISAPKLNVNVAMVPFGTRARAVKLPLWRTVLNNRELLKSLVELLAALAVLFGIARPLSRWMREALPTLRPVAAGAPFGVPPDPGESISKASEQVRNQAATEAERARAYANTRAEDAADLLKRWMSESAIESPGTQLEQPPRWTDEQKDDDKDKGERQ